MITVTRIYADPDGETHFEDEVMRLHPAGEIGHLSDPVPVHELVFRQNDPDYDYDWHPAPARQYIILLDGEIEIEVSDGEKRRFSGGDLLLVEDTKGKGHRTRHLKPMPRRSLFITLPAKG